MDNILSYPCNQSPQNMPFLPDISGLFKKMSGTFPKILCKDARFLLVHKLCANGAQINEMTPKIKFQGHFLSLFMLM